MGLLGKSFLSIKGRVGTPCLNEGHDVELGPLCKEVAYWHVGSGVRIMNA